MINKIIQISKVLTLAGFMLLQSCQKDNNELETSNNDETLEFSLGDNNSTALDFSSAEISDGLFLCDDIRVFRTINDGSRFTGFTRSEISFFGNRTFTITSRSNGDVLDSGTWSFRRDEPFSINFTQNTELSGVYDVETFLDSRDRVRARFTNGSDTLNFAFLCANIDTTPPSEEVPTADAFFTPFLANDRWELVEANGDTTNDQIGEIFNFSFNLDSAGIPIGVATITRESDNFTENPILTRANAFPSVSESFILNMNLSRTFGFRGFFDVNASADNSTVELVHIPEIPARSISSLVFRAVQ